MEWPILSRPRIVHRVEQRLGERLLGAAMLTGPPGAGKTTVARQVADRWADQGGEVLELVGLPELSDVPLAAFAPHAVDLGLRAADLTAPAVVTGIGALPVPPLLVVDDAPQLDATSAAVVHQLIRAYGLRAVLTARPDDIGAGPIERLLHEQVADDLPVEGFDAYEIRLLLRRRYDAAPRPDDVARLLRQTAGNPLLLREVVTRTEQWGRARRVPAGIELDPVDVPTDVRRSIADRIDALDPASLEVVAMAALGAGAPEAVLLDDEERRRVRPLVEGGVLVRTGDGTLRPAHPVLGEAALARLGDPRHGEVVGRVAARLAAAGDPALRFSAVLLRSETVDPPDRADLEWAIAHAYARGEHLLAVQLHEAALAGAADGEGALSVGADLHWAASMSWLGHLDDADAAFGTLVDRVTATADRALLVSRFGTHLAFRRFDVAAALTLADQHLDRLDPADRAALEPELRTWRRLAGASGVSGRSSDGGSQPAGEEATTPEMAVRSAVATIVASWHRGRSDDEVAQRLVDLERRHGVLEPHAADMIQVRRYFLLLADGQGVQAQDEIEQRRARCSPDAAGVWTYLLAAHLTLRGQLSRAATLAGFAVELLTWRDPVGFIGPARTLQAAIAAQVGDLPQAEELLGAVADQHHNDPVAMVMRSSAQALILAGRGETDDAVRLVLDTAHATVASENELLAALHVSIALRLGAARECADVVAQLRAEAGDRGLYVTLGDAAEALAERDGAAALGAAERLVTAGFEVTAIDVLHQAEQVAAAGRDVALRQRIVRLRHELSALSEATVLAPRAPGSREPGASDPTALTDRESEIAALIAARLTNREIADRLGISPSTVDNHLTNVYRKLGVSGRAALRAVLETTPAGPSA